MGWQPLDYTDQEVSTFERENRKKARFLVDESLGIGVAELHRRTQQHWSALTKLATAWHTGADWWGQKTVTMVTSCRSVGGRYSFTLIVQKGRKRLWTYR